MSALRVTLLSDGRSDRALQYVIQWLFDDLFDDIVEVTWADLNVVREPPKALPDRARVAVELHPCDVLFVHRDAERESVTARENEIRDALARERLPVVCVIPVRMTEAWFLFDAAAIRRAAGNPSGTVPLNLPSLSSVEDLPNPKAVLHDALKAASELRPRRRQQLNVGSAFHALAGGIDSFAPLRELAAFQHFEASVRSVVTALRQANA